MVYLIDFFINSAQICWHVDHSGSMFVNLSLLPALLNSKYLHDVTYLSEVERSANGDPLLRPVRNAV
jgi:hypothetical protein